MKIKYLLFSICFMFATNVLADCRVFEHDQYKGGSYVTPSEQSNVGKEWNDKISSVEIRNQCSLTVYQDTHFQGPSTTYNSDTSNLGEYWNDKISSLKCRC